MSIGLKDEDLDPFFRAAEGYVHMWERIETHQLASSTRGALP
jgi:hypothetical protein